MFQIERDIIKNHGGSVNSVDMCLGNFQPELIMHDKSKTLRDHGIAAACEAQLLYDFSPVQAPVLTTHLSYRTSD